MGRRVRCLPLRHRRRRAFRRLFRVRRSLLFQGAGLADAATAARPLRRTPGDHQRLALAAGNSLLGAMATFGLAAMAPAEKKRLRDRIIAGPPFTGAGADRDFGLLHGGRRRDGSAAYGNGTDNRRNTNPLRPSAAQGSLHGRCGRDGARRNTARHSPARRAQSLVGSDQGTSDRRGRRGVRRVSRTDRSARNGFKTWWSDGATLGRHCRPVGWRSTPRRSARWRACTRKSIRFDSFATRLGEMRLADLAVGPDGRNRTLLSPFGTKTGRNAPSSSRFVFGPATWIRFLIRPTPGRAVAYVDYRCQEIAIAAAMSGDERLIEAVRSGDPYLAFAKTASLAPPMRPRQPTVRSAT